MLSIEEIAKLCEVAQQFPLLSDAIRGLIAANCIGYMDDYQWREIEVIGQQLGKLHAVRAYKRMTQHPLVLSKTTVENRFKSRGLSFKE